MDHGLDLLIISTPPVVNCSMNHRTYKGLEEFFLRLKFKTIVGRKFGHDEPQHFNMIFSTGVF